MSWDNCSWTNTQVERCIVDQSVNTPGSRSRRDLLLRHWLWVHWHDSFHASLGHCGCRKFIIQFTYTIIDTYQSQCACITLSIVWWLWSDSERHREPILPVVVVIKVLRALSNKTSNSNHVCLYMLCTWFCCHGPVQNASFYDTNDHRVAACCTPKEQEKCSFIFSSDEDAIATSCHPY